MLYNNDDFEKLFRKAAKGYPLNTGSADWEALSEKLAGSKKNSSKKNKWIYSSLAFLLAFSFVSISIYKTRSIKDDAVVQVSAEPGVFYSPLNKKNEKGSTSETASNKFSSNKIRWAPFEFNSSEKEYLQPINRKLANLPIANNTSSTLSKNVSAIYIPVNTNLPKRMQQLNAVDENNAITDEEDLIKENANETINNAENDTKTIHHIKTNAEKRIYGIAYGGAEFTIVKFQKATNPGYRMGIAIGYKINNRLSIELGLQREHLDFYSKGKYIDTTLLQVKNTDVEQAYANSKITSVPLRLKYSIWQNKKGSFFIGAGVNAIIITHSERYDYAISKNGVQGNLSRNYSALTTPKYFSGVHFSGGYETKIGGAWSIKAEPYYQTPVKNFGVAKIPVSNFGVDIGIIKDLK